MAQRINCFVCNNRFIPRVMRVVLNFDAEKMVIALRYRNELNNPPIDINNNTRVCINCDELLRTDLANVDDPECIRLRVLKHKSSDIC